MNVFGGEKVLFGACDSEKEFGSDLVLLRSELSGESREGVGSRSIFEAFFDFSGN